MPDKNRLWNRLQNWIHTRGSQVWYRFSTIINWENCLRIRCGYWVVFPILTSPNDNVDENSDMHGIREFFEAYNVSFIYFWSWPDGVEEWDEQGGNKDEVSMNNLEKSLGVLGWVHVVGSGVSVLYVVGGKGGGCGVRGWAINTKHKC